MTLFALGAVLSALAPARIRGAAQASGSEELVRRVEASYHDVRSLRAEFTQTYSLGDRKRIESGTVTFARGGLMRWDYRQPSNKLFLCDGKELLLYVPEAKQLTRSPVKSSEDVRVPFRLLLSRLNLRKVFGRFEVADGEVAHEAGDHVLRAFPKRGFEEDYLEVLMELTPQFDIRRLQVTYSDHSTMEFRFEHVERNVLLPRSVFQFTPPAGTEIIDQH